MKLAPAPPCQSIMFFRKEGLEIWRKLELTRTEDHDICEAVRLSVHDLRVIGGPFLCQAKRVAPRAEGQAASDHSARAGVHALRCPRLPRDALHLAVFQHDVCVILQNLLVLSEVLGVQIGMTLWLVRGSNQGDDTLR